MIRVKTLKQLASRKRSIARVRWRCWEDASTVDSDGSERDPSTWGRWEEEYFLQVDLARAALARDPHAKIRPRGVIDQVPAQDLWAALNREATEEDSDPDMLLEYDEGALRTLQPVESGPWRLQCDQLKAVT